MSEVIYLDQDDLATLLDQRDIDLSPETYAVLKAMICEDPRFAGQVAELRAMAQEAQTDEISIGLELHRFFAKLLTATAQGSWEPFIEIFSNDPDGFWYRQLLVLAASSLKRSQERGEDVSRLLALEQRIKLSHAVVQFGTALMGRTQELNAEAVSQALQRLSDLIRSQVDERSGKPR